MRPLVRFLTVTGVLSVLALLAVISTARSQTPTPAPAVIPWDEAELTWTAPTVFAGNGGSLADCATGPCMVQYIIEANAPGGNGWGPIALVSGATNYRVKGLWNGPWQFRVKAFWGLSGFSTPSPVATKNVVEPFAPAPVVTPPTGMIAK